MFAVTLACFLGAPFVPHEASSLLSTYILTSYAARRGEAVPLDTKRTPTLALLSLQSVWKFSIPDLIHGSDDVFKKTN